MSSACVLEIACRCSCRRTKSKRRVTTNDLDHLKSMSCNLLLYCSCKALDPAAKLRISIAGGKGRMQTRAGPGSISNNAEDGTDGGDGVGSGSMMIALLLCAYYILYGCVSVK